MECATMNPPLMFPKTFNQEVLERKETFRYMMTEDKFLLFKYLVNAFGLDATAGSCAPVFERSLCFGPSQAVALCQCLTESGYIRPHQPRAPVTNTHFFLTAKGHQFLQSVLD